MVEALKNDSNDNKTKIHVALCFGVMLELERVDSLMFYLAISLVNCLNGGRVVYIEHLIRFKVMPELMLKSGFWLAKDLKSYWDSDLIISN